MGGGTGGMVGWVVFALVVLIGAVSAAVALIRRSGRAAARALPGDEEQRSLQRTPARKRLDDRYAAGTIDSDEYRERVITLEQNG